MSEDKKPESTDADATAADAASSEAMQDKNTAGVTTEPVAVAGSDQSHTGAQLIWLLWLLVFIALGLAAFAVWQMQLSQQQQDAIANDLLLLNDDVRAGNQAQQDIAAELQLLQQTQAATEAALQKLRQREQTDNFDWALAEVEYLLVIAQERLSLVRGHKSAIAALESAAQRLRAIDDPGLIPVREQITADLNALKAVPDVDTAGMALYLSDLILRAETLPLQEDAATRMLPDAGEYESRHEGWRDVVGAIWHELKQLVVIQREDSPPPALLAPDERYYLFQNLRIELASARAAVLRHDSRNLHASIELIDDWLQRYFATDAEAVINLRDTLAKMRKVELAPALPDISGSLESVRAFQRRRAAG